MPAVPALRDFEPFGEVQGQGQGQGFAIIDSMEKLGLEIKYQGRIPRQIKRHGMVALYDDVRQLPSAKKQAACESKPH